MKGRLMNFGIRTLVGLASLAVAFASAEAAAPQYKWKIAHIRPAGTAIDKDVHAFADRLAKESGGRIAIEVFPASQLGDYTVVQERVSLGAVEMQVGPLGTTVDKRLNLPSAPYLAKTGRMPAGFSPVTASSVRRQSSSSRSRVFNQLPDGPSTSEV